MTACGADQILDAYLRSPPAVEARRSLSHRSQGREAPRRCAGPALVLSSASGLAQERKLDTQAAPLIVHYNPDGSFQSLANVGLIFNVAIPGQGTVLLDVGRIVIARHQGVVFEAGPHQEENGDTSSFCAALS